jgi:hypothetical protein
MKSNWFNWCLASAMLLVLSGHVLARRVNHDVVPTNIGKLPFSAAVKVSDVGNQKQFEITIKGVPENLPLRFSSPGGWLAIPNDGNPGANPAVTKAEKDGTITFTFQLSAKQVDRARFSFVADAEDWNRPFPRNGDSYQFLLKEFQGDPKK